MASNIVFVGTYALREGQFETWDVAIRDMVDFVKANVPRLVSFDVYVNEERSEATSIYVHPDAGGTEATKRAWVPLTRKWAKNM